MASLLVKAVCKVIDGEVEIIRIHNRKYSIPASYKLVHRGTGNVLRHDDSKKEVYSDTEHLVPLAHQALANNDAEAFFAIYCLVSDIAKHEHAVECGATPKHLEYTEAKPHSLASDRRAVRKMRWLARATETVHVPGVGKIGLGFLIDLVPAAGPLGRGAISSYGYVEAFRALHVPGWLKRRILRRLAWSTAIAGFIPDLGDVLAAPIGPDSAAAHDLSHWVNLRTQLSNDWETEDGTYSSAALATLFGGYCKTSFEWSYDGHFRKEVFGDGDKRHERESMA